MFKSIVMYWHLLKIVFKYQSNNIYDIKNKINKNNEDNDLVFNNQPRIKIP